MKQWHLSVIHVLTPDNELGYYHTCRQDDRSEATLTREINRDNYFGEGYSFVLKQNLFEVDSEEDGEKAKASLVATYRLMNKLVLNKK